MGFATEQIFHPVVNFPSYFMLTGPCIIVIVEE